MNSSRPYLIRALYQWIVDNDCTPHLLVNADYPGVQVPSKFVSDGQIVLNVSPTACLLYTSPSPRDKRQYRMPSSA